MLKIFLRCQNITQRIYLNSNKRFFNSSACAYKKYKYALDLKKQRASGGQNFVHYQYRKGKTVADGKILSYFTFDNNNKFADSQEESPKQSAYAEVVQASLEDLLASQDISVEIRNCDIEIVKVEVSPTLSSANVIWKLQEGVESNNTKEQVTALLDKHLHHIRLLLPAYSTVTQTPTVAFTYDKYSEEHDYIDSLFERIKSEQQQKE